MIALAFLDCQAILDTGDYNSLGDQFIILIKKDKEPFLQPLFDTPITKPIQLSSFLNQNKAEFLKNRGLQKEKQEKMLKEKLEENPKDPLPDLSLSEIKNQSMESVISCPFSPSQQFFEGKVEFEFECEGNGEDQGRSNS